MQKIILGIGAKLCNKEDILLGRYGESVGKILTGKAGAYNVACAKTIILDDKLISKDYLFYLLHSSFIQSKLRGISRSAQGGFNKGKPDNSKGMEYAVLGGYSVFKEFYNPSYDKPAENFEVDNRATIYWNPYLLTNKKSSRVRIEFYNNDISKRLQIVLEGINANGKLARVVKYIE